MYIKAAPQVWAGVCGSTMFTLMNFVMAGEKARQCLMMFKIFDNGGIHVSLHG